MYSLLKLDIIIAIIIAKTFRLTSIKSSPIQSWLLINSTLSEQLKLNTKFYFSENAFEKIIHFAATTD